MSTGPVKDVLSVYVAVRFATTLGMRILDVAIGWLVYDLTHSPLALGALGLVVFLPSVPVLLGAGSIIDSFNRRTVLLISYALAFAASGSLLLVASLRLAWPLYLGLALVSIARMFTNPAALAILAGATEKSAFAKAFSIASSANEVANIAGPALSGLLYPVSPLLSLGAATLCFLFAGIAASQMPGNRVEQRARAAGIREVLAGFSYIRSSSVLVGAIGLDLVATLLGGVTILLPAFVSDVLHEGPWALGFMRSSMAIGAIIGSALFARLSGLAGVGKTLIACVAVYGAATIGFGMATNLIAACACMAILGVSDVVSVIIRQTLVQAETPDELRGRVAATHNLITGTANNFGDFESGLLASYAGIVPTIVIGGSCALLAAFLWARYCPALSRRRSL